MDEWPAIIPDMVWYQWDDMTDVMEKPLEAAGPSSLELRTTVVTSGSSELASCCIRDHEWISTDEPLLTHSVCERAGPNSSPRTGAVVECMGSGVESLSCMGMVTICNMGGIGATTSMFPFNRYMPYYLNATKQQVSHKLQADENTEYISSGPWLAAQNCLISAINSENGKVRKIKNQVTGEFGPVPQVGVYCRDDIIKSVVMRDHNYGERAALEPGYLVGFVIIVCPSVCIHDTDYEKINRYV
ncbi:hypothetical protein FIBSPDRAFT_952637 [Athelia psychrophila]|uniref:Aconitase/3-isopropylmalate dehydratase large subunit alpha/beta/alpha domain-containing protein n=1 Tax=Athelia psychrophila TaxID=1759441 RepID=A0A166LCW0_9AGAM|nr:hypothetical protein FIBSPDRAFT_952637 [Fibularhizoctonia sp. CBS 109695]